MYRNGMNIFLFTSDQPLDTVLFFTTTQQKLFWSSRFTGAYYNNCRSTANIQAVLSMQTQKADYCIISSEEATLFIPILGAKPKLTGFTTHCVGTGQQKEKRRLKWFYTQCQADTEHLKMAIVHLSEDTRVDSLPLKDGYSSRLQFHRSWKVERHNSSVKIKSHPGPQASPFDVSPPQPGWCGGFCTTTILTLCPNSNHLENPIVKRLPVTLSHASLPTLFNRAAPAGPVPNLSKSVFQQIIGSKGREVSLLFLPVCLILCSVSIIYPFLFSPCSNMQLSPKKD